MDSTKMMEYAKDLRADLEYAFEQGEGQTPNHKDVMVMDWLIEQAKTLRKIADTWVAIETNGTSEDANNFYTIVQDIFTEQELHD